MLRILVTDDHEVVRQGICSLLQSHHGWEICGEAVDGRQAVAMASQLKPDVVILDIGMPNLNGLDAARQILCHEPDQKILILTISDSEEVIREVLAAGARGYLLKSDAAKDLVAAVEALERSGTFFTSKVRNALDGYLSRSRHSTLPTLTGRERQVLQLVAEGKSSKEVAIALDLSVKTVETHRTNVMRKLDLHSITELVLYAIRNDMVQIERR